MTVTIAAVGTDRFAHDRYLVDQLIRPMANLYRITPLAAGETPAGGPVAFVRQKKLSIKEDIRFYADETESEELFRIKARSVFDTGGSRYDVTTPNGAPIGTLHHRLRSLIRSTWLVSNAEGEDVAVAHERSLPLAILRRVIDFVPYGEWVPVPYNFDVLVGDRVVGHLNRLFQLRDRYVLDVAGDTERRLDRRVGIALAVGLDALQNR
jgi:uncharacterized protein YxjI